MVRRVEAANPHSGKAPKPVSRNARENGTPAPSLWPQTSCLPGDLQGHRETEGSRGAAHSARREEETPSFRSELTCCTAQHRNGSITNAVGLPAWAAPHEFLPWSPQSALICDRRSPPPASRKELDRRRARV